MHSKFIYSSVLLLFLLGCNGEVETPSLPDGKYEGVVILNRGNGINGSFANWSDTVSLVFQIEHGEFVNGACEGEFSIPSPDTVSFQSNDCGCMCDCNPLVDCEGNILLGKRPFKIVGDSLNMQTIGMTTDSLSFPGVTLQYTYDIQYYFKRI